ncbi:MAG TPA: Nif3-like dinuclear metal center hexameric protein [Cytophagales bacterium]|nr:Nif3-like dinuclear metal center hexameric protein [Cytophagales bacterium]
MTSIKEIINTLESFASKIYQENYDNSGLIVGDESTKVTGILVSLDCTEAVVDEALQKKCNMIISHHPIVFKGLKKLTGSNYVEKTIIKAIKNDIAIYAIHTNLDNVAGGVNFKIAAKLGLVGTKILSPKHQILKQLITFVPKDHVESLAEALHEAGAGQIGDYKECSFRTEGVGTFIPMEGTHPYTGKKNVKSYENEVRLEIIVPAHKEYQILTAMRKAHPYEEVAYYLLPLANSNQEVGAGAIGILDKSMETEKFLLHLKQSMGLSVIRHTPLLKKEIKTVAVCGGSGSFLLPDAIKAQADIFITADYKYHEFFDAENHIIIADIGHYESEVHTKDLIYEVISKKLANIAVILSEINTNPINYF